MHTSLPSRIDAELPGPPPVEKPERPPPIHGPDPEPIPEKLPG